MTPETKEASQHRRVDSTERKYQELQVEIFEQKIRIKELGILVISKTQRNCRFRERTSKE